MTLRSTILFQTTLAIAQSIAVNHFCSRTLLATEQVYEIDRQQIASSEQIDMHSLLAVVSERLGGLGYAKQVEGSRLLIRLNQDGMHSDQDLLIKRISLPGHLELRICANAKSPDDKRLVDVAAATPVSSKQVQLKGVRIADWLPTFSSGLKRDLVDDHSLVCRIGLDSPEVFVLQVDGAPTGANLLHADRMNARARIPAIKLRFNADGKSLLAKLDKQAQNENEGKASSYIGVVMDKYFAGVVARSKTENEEIVVHCASKESAEAIVAILNAGVLPYSIRKFQSKRVTESQP